MTTLTDIRDRVRSDLRDLDPDASRWSDAELDRHIARALADVSLAAPLEAATTVATTPGSRELTTIVLPDFLEVESVEMPIDAFPPRHVPFSVWAATITLDLPSPPEGERASATSPATPSTSRARRSRKRSMRCSRRGQPAMQPSPGAPLPSTA